MPDVVLRFSADRASLSQTYRLAISPAYFDRMERFYTDQLATLAHTDFDTLSEDEKLDFVLLHRRIVSEQHQLAIHRRQAAEMQPLLPFAGVVEGLVEQQRKMLRPEAEHAAAQLTAMLTDMQQREKQLAAEHAAAQSSGSGKPAVDPVVAYRAVKATRQLQDELQTWFSQNNAYDPAFTWWVDQPFHDAIKALAGYSTFLQQTLVGIPADDKTTIIGDPVGRTALREQIADDLIPYSPEELIAIAQTEYDWCMREMLKASAEMGFGDNWHAAVEKVKTMHVPPGEQPALIRKLVVQGSDFVKQHDLVTVPPLADETWRMIMMTPERQLVNPFFTGGDEISVSYPTNTMTFAQREMSMRGNNIPFAHATAFHEMIPGHFLQFFMGERYHPYRSAFDTPFWVEGNALWWEMLFYEQGFHHSPEERIGALVWRMHRSARVIFTMNFHLGKWSPQQCVQFLIDAVGFEPDNATAEVRRSFDGSVGPLYQCAYLMGALQFRALHHELVDSRQMTNREFHDTILHENTMPVELLRAFLERRPLTRDYQTRWMFYGEHPTHP